MWQRVWISGWIVLLAWVFVTDTAWGLTPLERDLKKVNRYLGDGFCEDAFKLANELRASKEGEKNFDVWYGVVESQFCLKEVYATVQLIVELRKLMALDPVQESKLTSFARNRIESAFGELRFSFPPGKEGTVEITISRIGNLRDQNLEPYFESVKKRLAAGIAIPATVYLPFGDYEIDQVERTIEDYRGISFVIGKERLSRWKRTQIGDGQAMGVGYVLLQGFEGETISVQQPDGTQVLASGRRPSFSSTPFVELSSTHSMQLGTMGMVGIRGDLRLRPPLEGLGGVTVVAENTLVPSMYSVGAAIQLELPAIKGINFHAGLAARLGYLTYVRYVAFSDVVAANGDIQTIQIGLDLPAFLAGPEVTFAIGKAFRSGSTGIQLGLEVQGGITVLAPVSRKSEVVVVTDSGAQELLFELKQERPLWGPTIGGMLFLRTPFF